MSEIKNFYKNKKILITGHSGFKGAWMSHVLKLMGAEVVGFSDLSVKSGYYKTIKNHNIFEKEIIGDINDQKLVKNIFLKNEYDLVFHLAAQGLVTEAFRSPRKTLETNLIGTFNLLEACNNLNKKITLIIATTDKIYKDPSSKNSENYPIGAHEIYSASKASLEILLDVYQKNIKNKLLNLGIVRAGNVLGGGDYGKDRILTDIITSIKKNSYLMLKNPNSLRPWQYILDSIHGYLLIGKYCSDLNKDEVFNLNSAQNNQTNVAQLARGIFKAWSKKPKIRTLANQKMKLTEVDILRIDSSKAKKVLNWNTKYDIENISRNIYEYEVSKKKFEWSRNHIEDFFNL